MSTQASFSLRRDNRVVNTHAAIYDGTIWSRYLRVPVHKPPWRCGVGMNIMHGSADERVDVGAGCALSWFVFRSKLAFFFGWRGIVLGLAFRVAVQKLLLFLFLRTFIMCGAFASWWCVVVVAIGAPAFWPMPLGWCYCRLLFRPASAVSRVVGQLCVGVLFINTSFGLFWILFIPAVFVLWCGVWRYRSGNDDALWSLNAVL